MKKMKCCYFLLIILCTDIFLLDFFSLTIVKQILFFLFISFSSSLHSAFFLIEHTKKASLLLLLLLLLLLPSNNNFFLFSFLCANIYLHFSNLLDARLQYSSEYTLIFHHRFANRENEKKKLCNFIISFFSYFFQIQSKRCLLEQNKKSMNISYNVSVCICLYMQEEKR